MIAVSDPDVQGDEIDVSSDDLLESVLRGNYGTWIQMMGFETLGLDIVNNKHSKQTEQFDLISLNYKAERYVFLKDSHWEDVLGLDILFGLQEDIFIQIVIAAINGYSLSKLDSIVQLIEGGEGIDSKDKEDENNLDVFIDSDVYIYNDKAIAIKLSKLYESDITYKKLNLSLYLNRNIEPALD